MLKNYFMIRLLIVSGVLVSFLAKAQTNPTAQTLPYSQNFGTATFTAMPAGMAAWNGLNGGSVTSQGLAESSAPSGNAGLTAATAVQTGGGVFGYMTSSNARAYIQTSSNATNGANQIALAINTTGRQNITLAYDVEIISAQPRTIGVVAQYRIGTTVSWTTITGTGNPYSQAGGTTGVKASPSLTLPAACNNQAVVQIRWAIWRGTETGNSSGLAIDNISVTGSILPPTITLSKASINFGNRQVGTNSADSVYVVSGQGLSGDITITAPTDYAITLTSGSGYTSTLTLTQVAGNVANTNVFVRYSPTAAGLNAASITHTSAGGNNPNLSVSGTGVSCTPPTILPVGPLLLCDGASATLTSSSGASYTWSNGATTQSVTVSTAGSYSVTVDDGAGCSATSAPVVVNTNTFSYSGIVFSENMATTGAITSVNSFTGWQNNNVFSFNSTTASQPDVRTSTPSNYVGASGNGNVFFTTGAARNFIISGINTTGLTGLTMTFGMLQSSIAAGASPLTLEFSTDGINWTAVSYGTPAGTTWGQYTVSSGIPATSNLRIRFSKTAANIASHRLDDVIITGTSTTLNIASTTSNVICGTGSLRLISNIPSTNLWSTGATTQAIDVNTAGTYSTVVTVSNGCSKTSNTINVIVATPPSHTATGTNLSCNASLDGSIAFSVTNGTAPFQYSVNNGSTYLPSSPVTGLNTGTYVTTVLDANGCVSPAQSVTLTQPTAITFSASGTPVSCVGGTNGGINITGEAGGVGGPFQYSIDNGGSWQTGGSFTGLSANTYQVRVKDASGCVSPATAVVVGSNPVVYTITASAGSNGSISPAGVSNVNCGTGLTYTITPASCYQISDVLVDGVSVGAVSSYTFSNVTANRTISVTFSIITYTVTSSAGTGGTVTPLGAQTVNCNDNINFTISSDPGFVILDVLVNGNSVGPVSAYSFNGVQANQTISASFAACNNPATANAGPDASICAGASFTLAGMIGGGATDGVWSTSGSGTFNRSNLYSAAIDYSPSAADIAAGSVTLTLTSDDPDGAGGCPAVSDQMTLSIRPVPAVSIGGNNFFCTGGSTLLSANVSAGGPATSWSWSLDGSPISGANSATYSASNTGNYVVAVSNSFGCSSTSAAFSVSTFSPPVAPVISPAGPLSICSGSSTTLSSSYPSGNTWSTGATTESISVSAAGSYTVTYTDGNGCTASSDPVSVSVILTTASITAGGPTTFCAGDSVLLTANAGTAHLWSNGATTQSIYAKTGGNYTVTVTNSTGCTATSPFVTVTVNTYSFTGVFYSENMGVPAANTDITVYTNFQNQNIIGYSSTTLPQSQVRATTASTNYTGASGGGNMFMGFTTSGNNERDFIISGINSRFYTGITLSFGMLRSDLATSLVVEVSTDGTNYTPLTVTMPAANTWTRVTASGTIPATANLRIRFRKSAANTTQFRVDDIQLSGTTSRVAVTAPLGANICDGGFRAVLSNIPIGNNWSNGDIAQASFVTFSGDFYTYVIGSNGCKSFSDTVTTTVIPIPTISTVTQDPTCGVDTNGAASAEGLFATAPYSYSWNTSPVTVNDTASNLRAGTYTVTVTDANGCSAQSSVTINPPPSIEAFALYTPTCFGLCSGTATAAPLSGLSPYTYVWDTVNKDIGILFNIEVAPKTAAHPFFGQGSTNGYTVNGVEGRSLTLVRGVTYSFNINATGFPFIISTDSVAGNYTNEVLNGVTGSRTTSGTLTFTPNATHPSLLYYASGTQARMGYRLRIVDGLSGSSISGLCSGVYTVQMRDSLGCSGQSVVFISENPQVTATCVATNATCYGGNGSIAVSATGGTAPYTGEGTFNVPAGNYSYTVTDVYGCTASCSATITEPAQILVTSFSPASGAVGSSVTLTGSNFTGATAVHFNGISATFTVDNDGQITATVPVGASSGVITVFAGSCQGASASSFTVTISSVTLQLKLVLQGYYDVNLGAMQPTWTNQSRTDLGNGNPGTPTGSEADLVRVELYDAGNTLVHADSVMIMTNGTGTMACPPALLNQSVYILVKHRSHVQTRSAGMVSLLNNTAFDFTTSDAQADNNGSNASMAEVAPGLWAFWAGDVNQDGFIGGDDVGLIDNDNLIGFAFEYLATDVSGDGFVGGDDVGTADNNNIVGIYYLYP